MSGAMSMLIGPCSAKRAARHHAGKYFCAAARFMPLFAAVQSTNAVLGSKLFCVAPLHQTITAKLAIVVQRT
jgi:hypothetical protein